MVDGDTLRLRDGRNLRLIGINTPELGRDGRPDAPGGRAATQALRALIGPSARLALRNGTESQDRHGRLLAHAFLPDGRNLTAELLAAGLGYAVVVPPNEWAQDCYFALERRARARALGLWDTEAAIPAGDAGRLQLRGFARVRGRIERIGRGRETLWLNLPGGVEVKLSRADAARFNDPPIEALQGREVIVRGWWHPHRGRLRTRLRHPAMLERVPGS